MATSSREHERVPGSVVEGEYRAAAFEFDIAVRRLVPVVCPVLGNLLAIFIQVECQTVQSHMGIEKAVHGSLGIDAHRATPNAIFGRPGDNLARAARRAANLRHLVNPVSPNARDAYLVGIGAFVARQRKVQVVVLKVKPVRIYLGRTGDDMQRGVVPAIEDAVHRIGRVVDNLVITSPIRSDLVKLMDVDCGVVVFRLRIIVGGKKWVILGARSIRHC